jgi:hypothetical protein
MAVLFFICSLLIQGQEPTKKQRKEKAAAPPMKTIVDTTTVSRRAPADTLLLEQSIAIDKLDSLILEKKKAK